MKLKLYFVLLFLGLVSIGFTLKAQSLTNPVAAPYYGTAKYPYWGKYVNTPMTEVKAAKWIKTDGIVIGWDWSLPEFVQPPKKSTFSLLRNSGLSQTNLNTLKKPNYSCNPSVAHWVKWRDFEPVEGNINFQQLINNVKLTAQKGYQSIVRIHFSATEFAPDWMKNYNIPTAVGSKVTNYQVSHPEFHKRYLRFIDALGKSGIPQMPEVQGLYLGYASGSYGDEGIGPFSGTGATAKNDTVKHVRERIEAWANACKGVENKVFMGGISNYGISKGFGIRRGFVEMYLYNIPNDEIGQMLDNNNYLYVNESNPIIAKNLFHGEENEEYAEQWATAAQSFRFGTSTESFPYRYFTSNIRLLQMRCNELLNYSASLMPEMLAWVGQELGRTVDEAPDVWCFLRESYLKENGGRTVKNFERWLFQRDAPGYTTTPAIKIEQAIQMWMVEPGKYYDFVAREGKKIGFNIDKNWQGIRDSLAFKVSLIDQNAGTLNLNYFNGKEMVKLSKPLQGDSLLKTFTLMVSDYKPDANIGGKFDFTLEAGENTKSIVVSFVRVINSGIKENTVGIDMNSLNSKPDNTISVNIFQGNIKVSSTEEIRKIDMYTILGTKVKSVLSNGYESNITTSGLISGIYLIVVFDANGKRQQKKIFIK